MIQNMKDILRAVLCVLVIDACGGTLGGNPEVTGPDGSGQTPGGSEGPGEPGSSAALTFSLTDAPIEDAQNVFVTITSVQIAQEDGNWLTIPMETEDEIDLLQLQDGKTASLASIESLPAGNYGQTRLILDADAPGRLIDKDGNEHALVVPSGSESGLKIQTSFTKVDNESVNLTIDFDLRKSIKSAGNGNTDNSGKGNKNKYVLKPVLRLTDDSKSGSAEGEGTTGSIVCVYAKDATKDNDDACEQAITSTTVKNGKFKLSFLDAGTYDLRVFRNQAVVGDVDDVVVSSDTSGKSSSITLP